MDQLIANKTGIESSGDNIYSNLILFFAKGRKHLIFVLDGRNLVFYNNRKDSVNVLEMSPGIKRIERYSAFVMVTYANYVEFVLFDERELLDTISKISSNNNIESI